MMLISFLRKILQMRNYPLALAGLVLGLTTSMGTAEERIAGGQKALRAMPGANQERWVSALKPAHVMSCPHCKDIG